MIIDINQSIIDEINQSCQNFSHLLKDNEEYYSNQLNKINSNFYNNLARTLLTQYHYKYYNVYNKLIEMGILGRDEYDFYNKELLDDFLDDLENNLIVVNKSQFEIFISILDISDLYLKNAIDEKDFDSILNSFFQLKNKLESDGFIIRNEFDIIVDFDDNVDNVMSIEIGAEYVS